jgi:hypothetical protein
MLINKVNKPFFLFVIVVSPGRKISAPMEQRLFYFTIFFVTLPASVSTVSR